jgi:SAM-dependent methyltransferase
MVTASATFSGPRYYEEFLGPIAFGPFAIELAQRLRRDLNGPVLEIACGTGLVTRELRRFLDPTVQLVATDVSSVMLDYARTRSQPQAGIDWRIADAMALPFETGAFGAVVSGFGMMFPPDRLAALKEARRVLREGGELLLSVWDSIEENPHALVNAEVVEALFPDDPSMKFRTPYALGDTVLLRQLLEGAGFSELRIEVVRKPFSGIDAHQLATGQILGTPRAALIAQKGVDPQVVIGKIAAALRQTGGDPYAGYAQGLIVAARAP